MGQPKKRLHLQGFNNLTKTLSFNIYDVCYASTAEQVREYIAYTDEVYSAERLTRILADVCNIIEARILNIARQDYEPEGASVTMLIAESDVAHFGTHREQAVGPGPAHLSQILSELSQTPPVASHSVVGHLDKSHITVHTYPETHPQGGIATFRVDIDVSTCGHISPLRALNYLIHSFDSDIVTADYRVRGFTRDVRGRKHFIDHRINSIQNFMDAETKRRYQMIDVNVYQENIFHTKMLLKDLDMDNYLFGGGVDQLSAREAGNIRKRVKREMLEIFYGRNFSRSEIPS